MSLNQMLNIILFHIKKILIFSFATFLFAFIIAYFFLPLTYSSDVKILPPDNESNNTLGMLLNNSGLENLVGSSFGGDSQLYAQIIKSRAVLDKVISDCSLKEFWQEDNLSKVRAKLKNILDVSVNKEGIIKVEVALSTPPLSRFSNNIEYAELSAKIANSITSALDAVIRKKMNSKSYSARVFIEGQINETKEQIKQAEIKLKDFQLKNKTISLPDQLRSSLEAAAKVKSEIIFTEIKLDQLKREINTSSSVIKGLEDKLSTLEKKYKEFEIGNSQPDYFPPFGNVPEISIQLAELTRELKILNEVYTLLQKEYYKELINEKKNVPVVQILDEAVVPDTETKPRTALISVTAGMIGFFVIILILAVNEKKIKELKNYE